jgi:hypothetical protein
VQVQIIPAKTATFALLITSAIMIIKSFRALFLKEQRIPSSASFSESARANFPQYKQDE